MGTIRNEMTIVHHYNKDKLEKVREDAIQVFGQIGVVGEFIEDMVSPIMESIINQEYTFVINGDCSKIGWPVSEEFHKIRMEWCKKHKYDVQNIVVINFGEDESCYIVFDNKEDKEWKSTNQEKAIDALEREETVTEFADRCKECGARYGKLLKQKTGKWIKHDIKYATGRSLYYDCSQCGCAAPCTETANATLWKLSKYCPDCGATMENVKIVEVKNE